MAKQELKISIELGLGNNADLVTEDGIDIQRFSEISKVAQRTAVLLSPYRLQKLRLSITDTNCTAIGFLPKKAMPDESWKKEVKTRALEHQECVLNPKKQREKMNTHSDPQFLDSVIARADLADEIVHIGGNKTVIAEISTNGLHIGSTTLYCPDHHSALLQVRDRARSVTEGAVVEDYLLVVPPSDDRYADAISESNSFPIIFRFPAGSHPAPGDRFKVTCKAQRDRRSHFFYDVLDAERLQDDTYPPTEASAIEKKRSKK